MYCVTSKKTKSDQQQRPTEMHNKLYKSCDMFEDKCVWSALYPISNHSHIRQLQFATHAFSQQVLQQAVPNTISFPEPAILQLGERDSTQQYSQQYFLSSPGTNSAKKLNKRFKYSSSAMFCFDFFCNYG